MRNPATYEQKLQMSLHGLPLGFGALPASSHLTILKWRGLD